MTRSGEPRDEVVELRVHGVHGTSPASMLGIDPGEVRQVAGDNLTGFYRSKTGELPYRDLTGRPISVEAYSWGTLTSGVRGFLGWVQRALWLLLLPFALANLSYWARLEVGQASRRARAGVVLTRLGALLLTVFMVLIPVLVGIDLVAWQCYRGDSPGCERLPGVLDSLADLSVGQRLAAGSLLPLLFIAVLWYLARQSLQRYEEVSHPAVDGLDGRRMVLRHPSLWNSTSRTAQLQRVHLAVALAVVVGFTDVHVVDVTGSVAAAAVLAITVAVAIAATLWAVTLHPEDVEGRVGRIADLERSRPDSTYLQLYRQLPRVLLAAMTATLVVHLLVLWQLPADMDQQVDFVGHNFWFIGVFVALTAVHLSIFTGERMGGWWPVATVAVVLLLALGGLLGHLDKLPERDVVGPILVGLVVLVVGALGWWQNTQRKAHSDKAWNGAGSSVLLAAAAWVALLFTTGVITATANYLNGSEHGVDDLVSRLADSPSSIAVEAVASAPEGAILAVEGDVVIRDAVITLDGPGPVLRSGTVQAERLFEVNEQKVEDLTGVALQKGRTRLERGRVVFEADRVRVEDSCVRLSDRSACSPESSRFLVGGMLQLSAPAGSAPGAAPSLRILGQGDGVELETTSPPAVPLVVPQVLIWAPLAQTVWVVAALVWVLVAALRFRRTRGAIAAQVAADGIPQRDRADCVKARSRAAFSHRAERLLDGVGVITSVVAIALITLSAMGEAPWEMVGGLRPFATTGMYVALGLGLGVILLFSRIRTSEGTRKAVGVLWDLTTFWPRAAHPLAPPCYAERVVPELHTRLEWALHRRTRPYGTDVRAGNTVVLSGHSQGSLIVCALVSRLDDDDLGRVRVITYGSQIRALYGRVFPGVFGPDQVGYEPTPGITSLSRPEPDASFADPVDPAGPPWEGKADSVAARLHRAGGSWVNLFRRSDPLGFRVFSDRDQAPDQYVPEVPDVVVGDAGPQVNTHGGYQHTLVYRTAVAGWTGETPQPDPEGTTDIPALPV